MVLVALGDRVVLFGGRSASGPLADTWTWDGTDWTELSPAHHPPARTFARAAEAAGAVLVFGGFTRSGELNDTWSWDGTDWTELQPSPAPLGRGSGSMASVPGGALLFGGLTSDYSMSFSDTWLWNGTSWAALSAPGPSARGTAMLVGTR